MKYFMTSRIPWILNKVTTSVDVRDVAFAHLKALEQGISGERYIITNSQDTITWLEICDILNKEYGKYGYSIPTKEIPKKLMNFGNRVSNNFHNIMNNYAEKYQVDNSKSIRDLDMIYKNIDQTLIDMVEQMIKIGYLINKK